LAYRLPTFDAVETAVLSIDGRELSIPNSIRYRLATDPIEFSVHTSIPDVIEYPTDPEVTLTISNDSDRADRFVAGLTRMGPSVASLPVSRISAFVPAGESRTVSIVDDAMLSRVAEPEFGDGESDFLYKLDWRSKDTEESVRMTT